MLTTLQPPNDFENLSGNRLPIYPHERRIVLERVLWYGMYKVHTSVPTITKLKCCGISRGKIAHRR